MKKVLTLLLLTLLVPLFMGNSNASVLEVQGAPLAGDYMDSWESLPYTAQGLKMNVDVQLIGDTYYMTFNVPGLDKNMFRTKNMPHSQLDDFIPDSKEIIKMQYYTDKSDERNIIYYFQNTASNSLVDPSIKELMGNQGLKGFQPFVTYNIDTNEVNGTDNLLLYGKVFAQHESWFVDIVFPMELDDLLQITLNYDYRTAYGVLGWTWGWNAWENHTVERVKGEVSQKLKWWESLLKATIDLGNITTIDGWIQLGQGAGGKAQHIEERNDLLTSTYKTEYTKSINERLAETGDTPTNQNEIFGANNSLYRVYGDTMYRFWSTDFQIDKVAVVDVLYQFQGEYYHVKEADIESVITRLMSKHSSILDAIKTIAIILLVLLVVFIFRKPIAGVIGGVWYIVSFKFLRKGD